jgi:predicted small secreted protein
MKKTFLRMLPVVATGLVLTACNNAEEVKKQVDEQNAKIQSLVDEKLSGLQTEADATCAALVDSLANAKYNEWVATEGKKKGVKSAPKPKPTTTKTETKPTVGDGKPKMGNQTETTVGDGKPKMGGDGNPNTIGTGKPKMGSGTKP